MRFSALNSECKSVLTAIWANPGFATGIVLSLSAGVAVMATTLTVVFNGLVRPHPLAPAGGRVVAVIQAFNTRSGIVRTGLAYPQVDELRKHRRTFSAVGLYSQQPLLVPTPSGVARLIGARISAELFTHIQARPVLGRGLTAQDDNRTGEEPLVLSRRTWVTHFGSDPSAVGSLLSVGDTQFRVVGVIPDQVQFPYFPRSFRLAGGELSTTPEFWLPFPRPQEDERGFSSRPAAAVVPANVTNAQAEEVLSRVNPTQTGSRVAVEVVDMGAELSRTIRPVLLQLFSGSMVVLVIAAVTASGLVSARISRAAPSSAIRSALGGTARQIQRQFGIEGLILSTCATALGLLAAWNLLLLVRYVSPAELPLVRDVYFHWSALAAAGLIGLAAGITATVIPLLGRPREKPYSLLTAHTRDSVRSRVSHVPAGAVLLKVAVAIILVAWASAIVGSYVDLQHKSYGIDPDGLIVFKTSHAASPATSPDHPDSRHAIRLAIRRLPDAIRVSASAVPQFAARITVDERPHSAALLVRLVDPGYFETLGTSVFAGREFSSADTTSPVGVAVVNQSFAERFLGGDSPLGRKLTFNQFRSLTVVGLVDNVREGRPDSEPMPEIYLPLGDSERLPTLSWYVRARGGANLVEGDVARAVKTPDAHVAVYDLARVSSLQQESIVTDRLYAVIALLFAAVSWLFAVISIVGFVNHTLSRRWREFGLRCAFGASTGSLVLMVARQTARPIVVGLFVGIATAWSLVAHVSPLPDVVSVRVAIGTGVGLLCSSLAAGILIPLRQVSHLNPSALLRR